MGDKSSIEWLNGGATWNPIRARRKSDGKVGWYCQKISDGCKFCYASRMNEWRGNGIPYAVDKLGEIELFLDKTTLLQPLSWKRDRLIFPCSMTDWMADFVPDEWRDQMLAVMALTPQHTYLMLTKRADAQQKYFGPSAELDGLTRDLLVEGAAQAIYHKRTGEDPSLWLAVHWPLPNVWLGVSCENQRTADERIPRLLLTPAAIRWISAEPLLGHINLACWLKRSEICSNCGESSWISVNEVESNGAAKTYVRFTAEGVSLIDKEHTPHGRCCANPHVIEKPMVNWVVAGSEAGSSARAADLQWYQYLRDQCGYYGTPFYLKQFAINGKKISLPELDGKQWLQYPEVARGTL